MTKVTKNESGSGPGPGRGGDSRLADGERNDNLLTDGITATNGVTRSPKESKRVRLPVSRNNGKTNRDGGENVGSASAASEIGGQGTVVATLSSHAATKPASSLINTPVPTIILPKNDTVNSNRTSLSKHFLMRRVRSRSKSDPQSVPDKSLFSRLFTKKSRRGNERQQTSNFMTVNDQKDDDEIISTLTPSDTNVSTSSLVDTGKTASSSELNNIKNEDKLVATSDPQYYMSLAAGDRGSLITYHKRMKPGDLRMQTLERSLNKSDKSQAPSSLR
ncbi:unnamed protein product, partial [Didymodactylos carnosus]